MCIAIVIFVSVLYEATNLWVCCLDVSTVCPGCPACSKGYLDRTLGILVAQTIVSLVH